MVLAAGIVGFILGVNVGYFSVGCCISQVFCLPG